MDYTTYVSQLSNLMVIPSTDANFTTFLPGCIDYAEQRIYRELDVLNTRVTSTQTVISSGSRSLTLSTAQGTFILVESMSAVNASSVRSQMVPVTKEFIDAVYPNISAGVEGVPVYFAPVTDQTFLFAPPSDGPYKAEVIGVVRPTALSATNTTTFLTTYCPDLFIAASMIFAFGYQRDFGGDTDDPNAGATWEKQYQNLLQSAVQEQMKAKYQGAAWTPLGPGGTPPARA